MLLETKTVEKPWGKDVLPAPFETPPGKHDWLTRTIIVGSAERRTDHSIFDYYAVL